VYEPRLREAAGRHAPRARQYTDYRQLLDQQDIDAVVIGSPDHWHAQMTIDAVQAGKDVYLEKPVTHSLEEAEPLQRAVEETGRVVQTGMQQRSWPHFQEAKSLIETGELGKITLVKTFWYQSYLRRADVSSREVNESQLNWKDWLGSAPEQPFNADRFFNWRWFWDFGGGALTDLFSHWVDVVHWYMGEDTPELVQAMGAVHLLDHLECPDTLSASLIYPGAFTVLYAGSMIGYLEGGGMVFRGTEGMLSLNRGRYILYPEHTDYTDNSDNDRASKVVESQGEGTLDHLRNFLECVRSRGVPNAPITAGIAAARAGQLANQALREQRMIRV
jgi:predicted dehydrogenase